MKKMIKAATSRMMSEQEVHEFMERQLALFFKRGKDQFLFNAGILQKVLRMSDSEFEDVCNKVEDEVNTRTAKV